MVSGEVPAGMWGSRGKAKGLGKETHQGERATAAKSISVHTSSFRAVHCPGEAGLL